ncbi:Zn-dependent hydrolase [Granulicella tundricola]|uniref:Amidase, hydantoinase/carbamoylase family n=1 Tax=Granulicella tundricola (strain ATCC BAA-1859 / DSM 23138 / MP5ACTX9) TaxID=1198114 RepID=E8WW34_GRATM|nr:Zn-dependent hydrolase [Granulicella tundricola]ADW67340.1 amidase, hydantoinase/carbamoylase family [Granulicella tundricola MP5ACTX9]
MSGTKANAGVEPARVLADLRELKALTGDEHGAQRVAWTPVWLKARSWFEGKLDEIAKTAPRLERRYDAAGNLWATLPGESAQALLMGGHLDSVPNGGWLDGCLGVLTALEVLRGMAEVYEGRPPMTIRVVDWADEEGARFGRSLFGSSAFAGAHSIAADRGRTDREGMTLEAALKACGYDVERIGEAAVEQKDAAAYLELHIEQGPVLEGLGLPLAVVLGTKGVERHAITFHGQEAHSGSTPMTVRRDALAAAAKLALEIRPIARKRSHDSVATMGSVKTFPGIVTAVVGRCETTLDMRDLYPEILAGMFADARAASERFAAEEGCTVEWQRIWSIEPIPFDPKLIELATEAVKEVAGAAPLLPSGPLHDAAEVSRAGIPTVMVFVQSLNGLSHNSAEDTKEEHLAMAVKAFGGLAARTLAEFA